MAKTLDLPTFQSNIPPGIPPTAPPVNYPIYREPEPRPVPEATPPEDEYRQLQQPSVYQQARDGHAPSIAQWINVYLRPQGIAVKVAPDRRPGYFRILAESRTAPDCDRLSRFICHRISKLNSPLIQGVSIRITQAGSHRVLWQKSVRLATSATRSVRPSRPAPVRSRPPAPVRSAAPPAPSRKPSRPPKSASPSLGHKLQRQLRRPIMKILGRAAIAAFVIGCSVEAARFIGDAIQPDGAQAVRRPHTVKTAEETVRVLKLKEGINLNDPLVTLTFGGEDVPELPMLSEGTGRQAIAPPPAPHQADITLVNLPIPLARKTEETTSPSALDRFKVGGVDLVNLAGNGLAEQSTAGLRRSLRMLGQANIRTIGAGRNQRHARRPQILEVKGQRIAFLGYSDSDIAQAGNWRAGTNPGVREWVAEDIEAIRSQVDWIVVSYQWNNDVTEKPAAWQRNLARFAIDQGADLVVGYHPTVMQGAEVYQGRAIAYSIGDMNLGPTPGTTSTADYSTILLKVSLRQGQMRLEFLPIDVRQSRATMVSGERGAAILQRLRSLSAEFRRPLDSPMILDVMPRSPASTDESPTPANGSSPGAAPFADPSVSPSAPVDDTTNGAAQDEASTPESPSAESQDGEMTPVDAAPASEPMDELEPSPAAESATTEEPSSEEQLSQ